jgi:hypothetical protein
MADVAGALSPVTTMLPALVMLIQLQAMEAGAPAPGCPAGKDACFYEEPDGDPGQCILAVQTGAGWHHARVANCTWMVIGSTPTPTVKLQQLARRDLLPEPGRELLVRFRLAVYERGEREADDPQPGTRTYTDFLMVCATAAAVPGCTSPVPIAGGTTAFDGRGRATRVDAWRRSWRFARGGNLVLGKPAGRQRHCPLDPEGMYGARLDC